MFALANTLRFAKKRIIVDTNTFKRDPADDMDVTIEWNPSTISFASGLRGGSFDNNEIGKVGVSFDLLQDGAQIFTTDVYGNFTGEKPPEDMKWVVKYEDFEKARDAASKVCLNLECDPPHDKFTRGIHKYHVHDGKIEFCEAYINEEG